MAEGAGCDLISTFQHQKNLCREDDDMAAQPAERHQ